MQKREARLPTSIAARVRLGERWLDATILNVSRHGMLLRVPKAPDRGTYIELRRASMVVIGRIVWSKGNRCGVRAQDVIDIPALTDLPQTTDQWKEGDRDRRVEQRRTAEQSAASSQIFGRRLQFAAIIAFFIMASIMILQMVLDVFGTAMDQVSNVL